VLISPVVQVYLVFLSLPKLAKKERDIVDYIILLGSLAVTGFTIYFFIERLRQQKLKNKGVTQPAEESKAIGVIIE
jgi:hypothetical protein